MFRYSLRTLFVAVMVVGSFLGWIGAENRFVRDRKAYGGQVRAEGGYAVTYPTSDLLCSSDEYPNRHEARLRTPRVPFWRRWLGDEPFGLVVVPAAWPKQEAMKVKSLFPESSVYWKREALSMPVPATHT
jgi:hypothetical protein